MSRETDSRAKIVHAARRLFYEGGFDRTSLADLARAAGVPKGNFYYHFPTKDDVLAAVIEARQADIEAGLSSWDAELPDARARLRRFVAMIASQRDDLVRFGCPTGSLVTEIGKAREDLRPRAVSLLELYVDFATRCFGDLGHGAGRARELAVRMVGRAQGAILMAHAYGDDAILAVELADLQAWLDGLDDPAGRDDEAPA